MQDERHAGQNALKAKKTPQFSNRDADILRKLPAGDIAIVKALVRMLSFSEAGGPSH